MTRIQTIRQTRSLQFGECKQDQTATVSSVQLSYKVDILSSQLASMERDYRCLENENEALRRQHQVLARDSLHKAQRNTDIGVSMSSHRS
jgi:hypothetical protein